MKHLTSCAYNMDSCCAELKFTDGSMIAIDTIAASYGDDTVYNYVHPNNHRIIDFCENVAVQS